MFVAFKNALKYTIDLKANSIFKVKFNQSFLIPKSIGNNWFLAFSQCEHFPEIRKLAQKYVCLLATI